MNSSGFSLIDLLLFLGADVLVLRTLYYKWKKRPQFKRSLKITIIWVAVFLLWCVAEAKF
jgi:hypothetical protein